MKALRAVGVAAALGAVFGATTSLVNDLSSPFGELGHRLVGTRWTWVTQVAELGSLLLDVGWAWAAVAVGAGWLAGAIGRAMAAGAVSLLAATTTYYVTDSLLRHESLVGYAGEARYWWVASLTLGPFLGAVGASLVRTGAVGLLAGLIVPVGALVQTFVIQPGLASSSRPAAAWALVIVSVAALAGIGLVVARFVSQRSRRPGLSVDMSVSSQPGRAGTRL
jgi:Family of unknown function (DUF6518)